MLVRRSTPESRDENAGRHIDYVGLAAIAAGLVALLYALNEGPTLGWGSGLILGSVVIAVVLLTAFVFIERRVSEPLIDLALFKRRSYDGALIDNLIYNITLAGTMYVLALYLEEVRGYDAFTAGLLLLPSTVGILAFIMVGARLELSRGPRLPLAAGFFIMGVGTFLVGFLSPTTAYWWFAAGLLIQGIGIGLYSTPLSDVAVGLAPPDESGAASGAFKMCSMVGGALGVAVFGGIYRAVELSNLTESGGGREPDQRAAGAGQRRVQQLRQGEADLRDALDPGAGRGPGGGAQRALVRHRHLAQGRRGPSPSWRWSSRCSSCPRASCTRVGLPGRAETGLTTRPGGERRFARRPASSFRPPRSPVVYCSSALRERTAGHRGEVSELA